MGSKIFDFLMKPAGAILAPLFLVLVAFIVGKINDGAPWLSPYATPTNVAFVLLVIGLSVLNYLTTYRGFKHAPAIQGLINVLGKQFGLQVQEDGVIGSVTATAAKELTDAVASQGVDKVEVRKAIAIRQTRRAATATSQGDGAA